MTNTLVRFLQLLIGAAGLLSFCLALLIAVAAPAGSAEAPSGPALFSRSAVLDTSHIDDLRRTSRVSSAPAFAADDAITAACAAVGGCVEG